jgi:uncharacterized protein
VGLQKRITANANGPLANVGKGPHLDYVDVGLDDYLAVIEGNTAFWSLIHRSEVFNTLTNGSLVSAFNAEAGACHREMHALRFGLTPSAVYFNPTERCNLNCTYCYLPDEMRRDGIQMSADEVCRALQILQKHFTAILPEGARPQVVFHGSEPLLAREAVFQAIKAFGRFFRFGIQTNATLLDEEAVTFLRTNQVGIGISLDGHNPEVGNSARRTWGGKGVFAQVEKVLESLVDYDGFNVICTVTNQNVSSLVDMVEYFHGKGVCQAMLNPVRYTRQGGRKLKPDNAALSRNFFAALDRSHELLEQTGHKLLIPNFANVLMGIVAPTARRLMCDISPCGAGRCFAAVSARGDVFPCSEFIGLPEFCGGNLFEAEMSEILAGEPFQRVTARRVEEIEPCARCAVRHFCGAPCPAEVYASNGTLKTAPDYCSFYVEQARYALRVVGLGWEDAYLWDNWRDTTEETFSLASLG